MHALPSFIVPGAALASLYNVRMAIIYHDETSDARLFTGASVAFGVFDGLHLGHRYLLDQAIATAQDDAEAAARAGEAALSTAQTGEAATPPPETAPTPPRALALTFDVDPDEVLRPQATRKLMSNRERLGALAASGVSDVIVLRFTPEFAQLTPQAFIERIFESSTPHHLHVGSNFHFGARGAGNADTLRTWGAARGMQVHEHHLVEALDLPISATRIREALAAGQVQEATKLLGHPYWLCGEVIHGRGAGADLGFATANLQVAPERMVLAEGVYSGHGHMAGARYPAAISVGTPPTFAGETAANVEAHLLDFHGDLTGKELCLEFSSRLRPLIKFNSTSELVAQVESDIAHIRATL